MKKDLKGLPKFLSDESLGLKVAANLSDFGIDIIAVAQVSRGVSDAGVLSRANGEGRIVITTDKDFGYLVYKEKLATEGVILIRLREESVENLTASLLNFFSTHEGEIRGKFIVIKSTKIRVKLLL